MLYVLGKIILDAVFALYPLLISFLPVCFTALV